MWCLFNKNGVLEKIYTQGNTPSVGDRNFYIFAFFEDLDIDNYWDTASIAFEKPDFKGTKYAPLFMSARTLTFNSSESTLTYNNNFEISTVDFEDGQSYHGFIFDFGNFTSEEDPVTLLDTEGLWKASIILSPNDYRRNVTGEITFNVLPSAVQVDEDGTELTINDVMDNIQAEIAGRVAKRSTTYLKNIEDFEGKADAGELDETIFTIGSYVFSEYYDANDYSNAHYAIYVITNVEPAEPGYVRAEYVKFWDENVRIIDLEYNISGTLSSSDLAALLANPQNYVLKSFDSYYWFDRTTMTSSMTHVYSSINYSLGHYIDNNYSLYRSSIYIIDNTGAWQRETTYSGSIPIVASNPNMTGHTTSLLEGLRVGANYCDIYNAPFVILNGAGTSGTLTEEQVSLLRTGNACIFYRTDFVSAYKVFTKTSSSYTTLTFERMAIGVDEFLYKEKITLTTSNRNWSYVSERAASDVEANPAIPSGTATTNLTALKIGANYYLFPQQTVDQVFNSESTNAQSGVAINNEINTRLSAVYKPAGSGTIYTLNNTTKLETMDGNVYNMTDGGNLLNSDLSTTAVITGDNVVFLWNNGSWKWDALAGFVDLSGKQNTLVSGTNIKSVNGKSILGAGNLETMNLIEFPANDLTYTLDSEVLADLNLRPQDYVFKHRANYLLLNEKTLSQYIYKVVYISTENKAVAEGDIKVDFTTGVCTLSSVTSPIVEANPTIPSGATPTTLSNLKVGSSYYDIPNIIDATSLGSTSTISDLVNLINYTNGDLTTLIQFKEIISYSTGTKVLGVCLVHIEHNYLNYYTININNGFHQYLGNNIPDTTLLVDLPSVVNMENPMTNACDIIVGGSSGTPTRLAKGTAGQVLTINSNADGLEWANVGSGGNVEANVTIPSGTTPTDLTNLKIGSSYYSVAENSDILDATNFTSTSTILDLITLLTGSALGMNAGDYATAFVRFPDKIIGSGTPPAVAVLGLCLVYIYYSGSSQYVVSIQNAKRKYETSGYSSLYIWEIPEYTIEVNQGIPVGETAYNLQELKVGSGYYTTNNKLDKYISVDNPTTIKELIDTYGYITLLGKHSIDGMLLITLVVTHNDYCRISVIVLNNMTRYYVADIQYQSSGVATLTLGDILSSTYRTYYGIPDYPSDTTKTYGLKYVNGSLQWVQEN